MGIADNWIEPAGQVQVQFRFAHFWGKPWRRRFLGEPFRFRFGRPGRDEMQYFRPGPKLQRTMRARNILGHFWTNIEPKSAKITKMASHYLFIFVEKTNNRLPRSTWVVCWTRTAGGSLGCGHNRCLVCSQSCLRRFLSSKQPMCFGVGD